MKEPCKYLTQSSKLKLWEAIKFNFMDSQLTHLKAKHQILLKFSMKHHLNYPNKRKYKKWQHYFKFLFKIRSKTKTIFVNHLKF